MANPNEFAGGVNDYLRALADKLSVGVSPEATYRGLISKALTARQQARAEAGDEGMVKTTRDAISEAEDSLPEITGSLPEEILLIRNEIDKLRDTQRIIDFKGDSKTEAAVTLLIRDLRESWWQSIPETATVENYLKTHKKGEKLDLPDGPRHDQQMYRKHFQDILSSLS